MRGDAFFEKVGGRAPFSKLHPKVAAFFKDYLSQEKVIEFQGRSVVNTHFPPYPSRAFDNLAEHFARIGDATERHLFSVTLAVTNRCHYRCWHCYNAGRNQNDIPLAALRNTIRDLQDLGAIHVTLTGGEPLLREDLEEIVASFDERSYLTLNTTGDGLTADRARALRDKGLFAIGVSLDSMQEEEHDRLRGRQGAWRTALAAVRLAGDSGFYPYVIATATREFLQPERFRPFLQFASEAGAREVHLLEPSATGRLAGRQDVLLAGSEKQMILDYQKEVAGNDALPILSSFLHLESPEAFGCGAGLTHIYIDGSGEVCPCNLVPLSFGNIASEPLPSILARMGCHFCEPRTGCVGHILSSHIPSGPLPLEPEASARLCGERLPVEHPVPRFFRARTEARGEVGRDELRAAYNNIHEYYDEFWLKEAAAPVKDLAAKLSFAGKARAIDVGCGTGFATALLARRLESAARLTAVDISEGMLGEARRRARAEGVEGVRFVAGDALETLRNDGPFDLIFSSWVLGYIPLAPFFAAASRGLRDGGQVAFVVHKENSPREPLEIFGELVARDPSVLQKRVAFDFPRNLDHVREELRAAGLEARHLWEGQIVFRYDTPEEVLEHLLKSGAGTAFHDALDPNRRESLEAQFLRSLAERHRPGEGFDVAHDYISCIAGKASA